MRILRDPFLDEIESAVPLHNKRVLEIGCGNGVRSSMIARRCQYLVSLESDAELLRKAHQENQRSNILYVRASATALPFAQKLKFEDLRFDAAIFTLSLHHIQPELMKTAIDEVAAIGNPTDPIIFFEPGLEGSFFEAEILFDACDGDERKAKQQAYGAILTCGLIPTQELWSETVFEFDSVDDFVRSLNPKRNLNVLDTFLAKHGYQLRAARRINIFEVPVPDPIYFYEENEFCPVCSLNIEWTCGCGAEYCDKDIKLCWSAAHPNQPRPRKLDGLE